MAQVDFLPFAYDPAANVLDQADYLNVSVSTWRALGFQTGTALSPNLNKVWRQSSLIASMIAQFSANATGADMLDDGSTTGQANLLATFQSAVRAVGGSGFTGQYLPLAGGTLTGPLVINAATALSINAPTGNDAGMLLNSLPGNQNWIQGRSNNNPRWLAVLGDTTPQSGTNLGANFGIYRYSDAGALIDAPLTIARNTGIVNFSTTPTQGGGPLPFVALSGGIMSGPLTLPYGITYTGTAGHKIGFDWDGQFIRGWVDNGGWVQELATVSWAQAVVGGYLPLGGGTITGNLTVNGTLLVHSGAGFYSSVWFTGLTDFINFWDGTTRYRQWAGNWWDGWNGSNGFRYWYCYGGPNMVLDNGANLSVSGGMTCNNGRLRSISGGQSSVSAWGTGYGACVGFWISGDGMWLGGMDGSGNPTAAWARVGYDGSFTVPNNYIASGSFVQAGGRLISYDRLNIHSGYPGVVMDNNGAGIAGLLWTDGGGFHMGQCNAVGDGANSLMTLNWSGWFYVSGGVGSPSDASLKDNIRPAEAFDSLAAVRRLRSVAFEWKSTGETRPFGLLASEVRECLPDVVRTNEADGLEHLDLTALVVHALRAIKQLGDRA